MKPRRRVAQPPAAPPSVAFYSHFRDSGDGVVARLSIVRQIQQCLAVLPDGALTAAYYDIGPRRGRQTSLTVLDLGDRIIHRAGGLDELLDEATQAPPTFDFVISAEMETLSRRVATVGIVIGELEPVGIGYLIASEMSAGEPLQTAALRLRVISNLMLVARRRSRGGRR